MRIGALCFYPEELNLKAMEKELMRHFKWKYPIALRVDWVAMPYDRRAKWNARSTGVRLLHLYTRTGHAKLVDRECRTWLHPNTPKQDLPWAAVVHYISDWKAAQRGVISVAASGSLKEQIVTMVSKAQDFQELTTVLYSDVDMPGMLRKVPTWQFGSSTLLKLLLSITAKPTQAALAGKTALAHEPSNRGYLTIILLGLQLGLGVVGVHLREVDVDNCSFWTKKVWL